MVRYLLMTRLNGPEKCYKLYKSPGGDRIFSILLQEDVSNIEDRNRISGLT